VNGKPLDEAFTEHPGLSQTLGRWVSAQGHICVGEAMTISRGEQELHGEDSTCHEKDGFDNSGENKCYQRSGHEEKKYELESKEAVFTNYRLDGRW